MNTQVIQLLEQAISLLKNNTQSQPLTPKQVALNKIGNHVDTGWLVVQVHEHTFNSNKTAGIIWYSHPQQSFLLPAEKKDYWVTKDKLDISVWDQVEDGKFYLIETHKFQKPGRIKDRWVWMNSWEIDEEVARQCLGWNKSIPKAIQQWVKSH